MDLHQIDMEDMFGPLLRLVLRSRPRSKVKVIRVKKRHFPVLLAACAWFMFGKTSLASSFDSNSFHNTIPTSSVYCIISQTLSSVPSFVTTGLGILNLRGQKLPFLC